MSYDGKNFLKLYESLINDFTRYDQTVDVVSCWESILNYGYKDELIYFDRFPNIPPKNFTPDFTALFENNYGLIFEVKRTFPKEEKSFINNFKQLLSYDQEISLRVDDSGKRIIPAILDIILIISSTNSNEIFVRLNKLMEGDSKFHFKNNLIFIDYSYQTEDNYSKYIFRKFMGKNRNFRDLINDDKKKFEYILGEQAKSFTCFPKHFMKYKINEVLCNDQPPELYMAVFLWTKVFYSLLTQAQTNNWRRGNTQKIQTINVNIDELLCNLNINYIPKGNVKRKWLTNTMNFFENAELAKINDNNEVEIYFRNLTPKIGHNILLQEGITEREEIRESAQILANYYCKNVIKNEMQIKEPKLYTNKTIQKKLI